MKITTTGRKVGLKDAFLKRVDKRMAKFDKYFDEEAQAFVTVTISGSGQTVELTVKYKDLIFRSERTESKMELAFDETADNIEKQIIKNKGKLGARIKKVERPEDAMQDVEEDDEYQVVKEKKFSLKPITVDEAIMRMNLVGHNFYVFKNQDSGETEVVYKRNDGDYGLIIPE
ncbi:MAG: ribosome hibernation-promoting factor, HPF/YfiA family [Oscillospiraceae bacterium]|jgi:putative sigma-54 modulation protein